MNYFSVKVSDTAAHTVFVAQIILAVLYLSEYKSFVEILDTAACCVSRETMTKGQTDYRLPFCRMWGVKEKDMGRFRTAETFYVETACALALSTGVVPGCFGIRTTYSMYSSVSLFTESASMPALRIVSTA